MKKFYYLKTCNTCTRLINELELPNDVVMQDIKSDPLTVKQLEAMHELSGSYEALFSKRAKLYKEMGLKDQALSEKDFKHYILEHYTFLKRPVFIYKQRIFIGNSKKTVEAAKQAIHEE
ncbi:arsenate reductase [Mangrovimonas yunxiaonensis]|uniref:Arsenate reductase n=1 Tax=Mangrovimonas yunxiaonensis TaxID=1197477 RepID=A0A084TL08_9FLAO|nr:ArsC/Spx/MgsR family protein [Mangrovimonas yunxiaonensis]KFB01394.1 arsenate reductase [Mangrovimonas yunxiaonensis]GGH36901.1 arsenate reductase [Mangrovimonas yunxiaonensis]